MSNKIFIMINALAAYLVELGVDIDEIEKKFSEEQKDKYLKLSNGLDENKAMAMAEEMLSEYAEKLTAPEDWEEEQHL